MGRIASVFDKLAKARKKALITFITAGDPELGVTGLLVPRIAAAGADIIELGIPFSDPMADGPTIQLASDRALAAGTTLAGILTTVRTIRKTCEVPIVLMGYYNPVFTYGHERFVSDAAAAGVDGLLLVDLPPEEAADLQNFARTAGIDLIFLLAPTSGDDRVKKVLTTASGFIYYVSLTGVTGAATIEQVEVKKAVQSIKKRTKLPVVVGFGISKPEQAVELASVADGVVVGSAIVRLFEDINHSKVIDRVCEFVGSFRKALDGDNPR